jgi:hypothetical protein
MRRRLMRRAQLIRARTRAKNEIQAVLVRRLIEKPGYADLFGRKGRRWLEAIELPEAERESVDAGLRQIDFLDSEVAGVEARICEQALGWPQIRRLMTVPGVGVFTAASFMAAIGDISRFRDQRKLVGYLGLDPVVRQSGSAPASHGPISKQGSAAARYALVEAAWSAIRSPGPLRAFYGRIKRRRGAQVAIVAVARKLACLFWCMLTRRQDYAYAQPSLTRKKIRKAELAAGMAHRDERATGVWSSNTAMRRAERELAAQGQAAYERMVADWQRTQPQEVKDGADATPGRASSAARQDSAPEPAL